MTEAPDELQPWLRKQLDEAAKTLIDDTESLYALADDERFWS